MTEKHTQLCDLELQSRKSLHNRALDVAADFRRCEADLFQIVSMIEVKKVYFDLGCTSLFQYVTELLRLSRHQSYDLITVVRKAREIPELKSAVLCEQISISKARRISAVITEKNVKEWLELAKHSPSRIVEKAVAQANPRSAVAERMSYVAEDVLQFQLAVSESWSELLTNVKDLMSQKEKRAVSSEEALFNLMMDYKTKNDPVLKAERALHRKYKNSPDILQIHNGTTTSIGQATTNFGIPKNSRIQSTDIPANANAEPENGETSEARTSSASCANATKRTIPAAQIHRVNLRDQNQCAFVDRHGKRCTQKRWLQKHHVQHFADGGNHDAENLKTLCWAHHAMEHRR